MRLHTGVIDGAEFVQYHARLYCVAPFYHYPGFNKPNGTGEAIAVMPLFPFSRRDEAATL